MKDALIAIAGACAALVIVTAIMKPLFVRLNAGMAEVAETVSYAGEDRAGRVK